MRSLRAASFCVALILAVALGVVRLFAAGPAVVMLYGGPLAEPVYAVYVGEEVSLARYASLTCAAASDLVTPAHFGEGAYVSIAAFWAPGLYRMDRSEVEAMLPGLRPENAHQHGRLYLPTSTASATVVTTDTVTIAPTDRDDAPFAVRPIPVRHSEFARGCTLGAADLRVMNALGVPGF